MSDETMTITISGGLCAPVHTDYAPWPELDDIWPNDVARVRGRFRRFFAWDRDWGMRLRGGPLTPVKLMDLIPPFRADRGGIRFLNPSASRDE